MPPAGAPFNTYDPTSIQNLVLYGTTTAGQTASFGLTAANVTVSRPAATIGQPEDRIIVTVNYPVYLLSVLLGQSTTWSGSSVPSWNLRIQVSTPYESPAKRSRELLREGSAGPLRPVAA
jgi:hypothetical protein